jgi:hypothetical protein
MMPCPEITRSDLEGLLSKTPGEQVTLWSLQQPGAIKTLCNQRHLTGNPEYAHARGHIGEERAYEWLDEQLSRRLESYDGKLPPVWAFPARPTHTDRQDDLLLRIEVPKRRVVFLFYDLWERLLQDMHSCLPMYFSISRDKFVRSYSECEKKRSWERMFDLELGRRSDLCWRPYCIQACLASIGIQEVKEKLSIKFRRWTPEITAAED